MKRLKLSSIKKKTLCALLFCILVVGCGVGAYFAARATAFPKPTHTIVIEAGYHGLDVKKRDTYF